jgi:hypothetical protein
MVSIPSLWLPILVSSVIVFLASWIIHMLLPYHRGDYQKLPDEEAARVALRAIPPGDYMIPRPDSHDAMRRPEFMEKLVQGPVAMLTVRRPGRPNMGSFLSQWFVFSLFVGVLAAYISGRALGAGVGYLPVFRFAGCTAFIAYGVAMIPESIWYGRSWSTTIKNLFDALIYGLLTAGTFGWLWPK